MLKSCIRHDPRKRVVLLVTSVLEPTGNPQIMEAQFHNSLIPSWANTTATLHALFKLTERTLKPRHLEEDCTITTFSENKILKFFFFFLHTGRATTSINIDCQLSFGSNVLVFNENKYFCLETFSAYFFLLNCLIFNIKTKQ